MNAQEQDVEQSAFDIFDTRNIGLELSKLLVLMNEKIIGLQTALEEADGSKNFNVDRCFHLSIAREQLEDSRNSIITAIKQLQDPELDEEDGNSDQDDSISYIRPKNRIFSMDGFPELLAKSLADAERSIEARGDPS